VNNNDQRQDQDRKDRLNNYARYTGIGFQMLVTIGLGVFAGFKLDERYPNKYKIFSIICSMAAIGLSVFSVIKQVSKSSKNNKP
jgi:F0F1-type ATP synthase assembly protein I